MTASDSAGSQTSQPAARIFGPGDAEKLRVRLDPPQRLDQRRSERVSRRLPRDQSHPQRRRHGQS